MNKLKFSSELVPQIVDEKYTTTWRLFDDKNISIGDIVELVNSQTNEVFAKAEVVSITQKYLKDINDYDMKNHKKYDSLDSIISDFKRFYGDAVNAELIVKMYDFKILNSNNNDVTKTTKYTGIKLYTDGGSRGNPGPSALGFVITDDNDQIIYEGSKYLGITTNNQAEYQAVKAGLDMCTKFTSGTVRVFLDSQLVANQMNGIYKIKNRELWPIHQSIKEISEQLFKNVSFTYIPREFNKLADAQVNIALDSNEKLNGNI
jgi:ribonuclease HI/uncharacterized protein YqfB (UPF0267 family)